MENFWKKMKKKMFVEKSDFDSGTKDYNNNIRIYLTNSSAMQLTKSINFKSVNSLQVEKYRMGIYWKK